MKKLGFIKSKEVRVRISPSPTGFLHIGTARTALFNYLFSHNQKGSFILRIEDTDLERSSKEFEKDIIDNLKWLGIEWDEGPEIGGPFAPYRQSERLEIYKKYLETLLKEGKAYYCFCSEEELEGQRQNAISIGQSWKYNGKCRGLTPEKVNKNLAEGKPGIIRLKMPAKKVAFDDLIRGKVEFDSVLIGDIGIAKNLNAPLYNFAVVVDDYEMKISHVIRGEDHISNTPKQILIQEALGFERPQYSHLPLILGRDRSKLSKRHGAISIDEFKKEGYLAEALINFMAFLGWNPGNEREIYSLPSLAKDFSLERVQKSGAVLNIKKLDSLNGFYIRQKSIEKLTELCLPYLIEKELIVPVWGQGSEGKKYAISPDYYHVEGYKITATGETIGFDYLKRIVALHQERLKKLSEIGELADFFFKEDLDYDKSLLKWKEMTDYEIKTSLEKLEQISSEIKPEKWDKENLENAMLFDQKDKGVLFWPLRVALTGKKASAGPLEIAEILGKEKTLKRIIRAKELL